MWDPESGVKFANNEPFRPFFKESQINIFNEEHRGDGVQHVGAGGGGHRQRGARAARARRRVHADAGHATTTCCPARLADTGIGADRRETSTCCASSRSSSTASARHAYLLQIFLKEAAGLLRTIRRRGRSSSRSSSARATSGFGAGNFRALFESIEREQRERARLMLDRMAGRRACPRKHHIALRGARRASCATRSASRATASTARTPSSTTRDRPHTQRRRDGDARLGDPGAGRRQAARRWRKRHYRSQRAAAARAARRSTRACRCSSTTTSSSRRRIPDGGRPGLLRQRRRRRAVSTSTRAAASLRSLLGDVAFAQGDYVFVPQAGCCTASCPTTARRHWLSIECAAGFGLPAAVAQRGRPAAHGRAVLPPRLPAARVRRAARRGHPRAGGEARRRVPRLHATSTRRSTWSAGTARSTRGRSRS